MLPDRVSNPGPLTYESGALRNRYSWRKIKVKDTKIGKLPNLVLGEIFFNLLQVCNHEDVTYKVLHQTNGCRAVLNENARMLQLF